MKITLNPNNAKEIRQEYQYGISSFASFSRIIEAMKRSGEMRLDAEVIGVQIASSGLVFIFKD